MDHTLLDNPIWNSLTTNHVDLAVGAGVGNGLARRYPADIGPLSALGEVTPAAFADLAAITPAGDVAILFLDQKIETPPGWQLLREGALIQMLCPTAPQLPALADAIVPLHESDFPAMVALATLTEPGPFRSHTAMLGGFVGIRIDGRLAAMAGRRLSPTGFTEVSAVCTHPDFRGRGYALALVTAVAHDIHRGGRTPFLTSFAHNAGAIRIYEQAGFSLRRAFELAVIKPPADPQHKNDVSMTSW